MSNYDSDSDDCVHPLGCDLTLPRVLNGESRTLRKAADGNINAMRAVWDMVRKVCKNAPQSTPLPPWLMGILRKWSVQEIAFYGIDLQANILKLGGFVNEVDRCFLSNLLMEFGFGCRVLRRK